MASIERAVLVLCAFWGATVPVTTRSEYLGLAVNAGGVGVSCDEMRGHHPDFVPLGAFG